MGAWIIALELAPSAGCTLLELAAFIGKASKTLNLEPELILSICFGKKKDYTISSIVKASKLPKSFLSRLQCWNIDVIKAALLANYSPAERPVATILTCSLFNLSVSNMRKFETLARDIALRSNLSVFQFLKGLRKLVLSTAPGQINVKESTEDSIKKMFLNAIENSGYQTNKPMSSINSERVKHWMYILETIRFPEKNKTKYNFYQFADSLKSDLNLRVDPPPDFEGDTIDVSFQVRSECDLDNAVCTLMQNRNIWRGLLELVQKGKNESL
jgi:hypothetical protein